MTNKETLNWQVNEQGEIFSDTIGIVLNVTIDTTHNENPILQLTVSNKQSTSKYSFDFAYNSKLNFIGMGYE
jgi:hypothetical protein